MTSYEMFYVKKLQTNNWSTKVENNEKIITNRNVTEFGQIRED